MTGSRLREYKQMRLLRLDLCHLMMGGSFLALAVILWVGIASGGVPVHDRNVVAFASLWAGMIFGAYGIFAYVYLKLMKRLLAIEEIRVKGETTRNDLSRTQERMKRWVTLGHSSVHSGVASRAVLVVAFVVALYLWYVGYPEYIVLNAWFTLLMVAGSVFLMGQGLTFVRFLLEKIEEIERM